MRARSRWKSPPNFDRADPHFQALLQKMNFPVQS